MLIVGYKKVFIVFCEVCKFCMGFFIRGEVFNCVVCFVNIDVIMFVII